MRNIIHLSANNYVVFVVPEQNTKVYSQANEAINFVVEQYKDNVKVLTWEKLYQNEYINHSELKSYYEKFKKKYVINS